MEDRLAELYHLPDITEFENVHLLTLRKHCASLEEKLYGVLERISDQDRQIIGAYIDMRDELELQSVKAALRWGKSCGR